MRLGIITFSCAYNYGAMLQCYALQETLVRLGHEVEVIDYRPKYLVRTAPLNFSSVRKALGTIKRMLTGKYKAAKKDYDRFACFEKSFYKRSAHVLKTSNQYAEQIDKYDAIVIGSDQIWNHRWNGEDPVWYGWPGSVGGRPKFITYAASAGSPNFNTTEIALVNQFVSKFTAVSARESVLSDYLSNKFNISAPVVLDPTLLADPSVWNSWKTSKPVSGDYIVMYQARANDNVIRIARKFASLYGWRIVASDTYRNSSSHDFIPPTFSPDEFVSLIANAKCVVTTSFHGTVFSLICHTPFYTLRLNDGADERAEGLLKSVGLYDRMISTDWDGDFSCVDFTGSDSALSTLRSDSLNFLKSALL